MRIYVLAGLVAGLAGCVGLGRDMHTERALDECEELVDVNEQQDCIVRVRAARRDRDMQDREAPIIPLEVD